MKRVEIFKCLGSVLEDNKGNDKEIKLDGKAGQEDEYVSEE